MPHCWTCKPFCDNCKPKFYDCPACGNPKASIVMRKCVKCGRAMTSEDERRGRDVWLEKRQIGSNPTE